MKLPVNKVYGCEQQIETDTVKGNKHICVNWQHHLSQGGEKLLAAPYPSGALRGVSRLIHGAADPGNQGFVWLEAYRLEVVRYRLFKNVFPLPV